MKKVRPVKNYDEQSYPSVIDSELDHVSRRGFLRAALTTSAAAGVMLATGGATSLAGGRRPKTYKARIYVGSRYTFRYGNYESSHVVVQSKSEQFIRFLKDKKETAGVTKAIRKVFDAHTCADLTDGKKLVRLQNRVAKAMVARYRHRTLRRVATPTVVILVTVNRYRHCRGKCRPAAPYCRVPKKRPRPRK